jgi:hypothetical protein
MDIIAGLQAATQAIDIAKALRNVERSYETVELKSQIVDLMDKLLDVKSALQDAWVASDAQQARIDKLEQAAKRREETIIFEGFRMLASADHPGKPQGYPFCTRCDEVDGLLISTVSAPRGPGAICPECKAVYVHAPIYSWDAPAW